MKIKPVHIVFRTDASLQIGSGHVMRCLTLAEGLAAQGATCQFICRQLEGNLIATIAQRGFAVTPLPMLNPANDADESIKLDSYSRNEYRGWLGISYIKDAAQTAAALSTTQPDCLVVDHYALDAQWENAMRPHTRTLMVIDDLANRPHQCDVLLDQNLGRQPQDYANLVPPHCKLLIGPQYALLRPEFAALRAFSLQRRAQPALKNLLITMGGVDQHNATGQVLNALKKCALPPDCRITVVMGLQAPWLVQVQAQALRMPWPTEVVVNISDMAQPMADSDLAIGAAGSTSWERCCLGLPTLMVVLADNQRAIARALQSVGAAQTLDDKISEASVCNAVSTYGTDIRVLNNMGIAAARFVDGLGTDRLVSYLSALEAP